MNHSGFYWSKRWWGGSGICWTICKSFAPRSRQTTMPVPHHSVFLQAECLPATQPTVSKHWRQWLSEEVDVIMLCCCKTVCWTRTAEKTCLLAADDQQTMLYWLRQLQLRRKKFHKSSSDGSCMQVSAVIKRLFSNSGNSISSSSRNYN